MLGAGGCRAPPTPCRCTPSHENHRHPQAWPSVPRGQNHPRLCYQNHPCPVSVHSVKCVLQSRYVISVRLFCQMYCGCLKGECFCYYGPKPHTCVPSTRNTSTNMCDRCVRFCWSCYPGHVLVDSHLWWGMGVVSVPARDTLGSPLYRRGPPGSVRSACGGPGEARRLLPPVIPPGCRCSPLPPRFCHSAENHRGGPSSVP